MDSLLLRCFLTVSDTSSFSFAATRLNVTQSTVSHQIARLEEHLGKQLFERTTRQCQLTPDGRELIPFATRILRAIDEMEQNFRPTLISGTVVIGVPDDYYLFEPIAEALRRFMIDKPNVAVEMRAGLGANHLRDLKDHNLDLALIREVEGVHKDVLRVEEIVWIAAPDWRLPADGVIPLAAVNGGCAYRKAAAASLDAQHSNWSCKFSCTSLEGVLSVVRAGLAISAVTKGDAQGSGFRILGSADMMPSLPRMTLSIRYSRKQPSIAARALAKGITNALATE